MKNELDYIWDILNRISCGNEGIGFLNDVDVRMSSSGEWSNKLILSGWLDKHIDSKDFMEIIDIISRVGKIQLWRISRIHRGFMVRIIFSLKNIDKIIDHFVCLKCHSIIFEAEFDEKDGYYRKLKNSGLCERCLG